MNILKHLAAAGLIIWSLVALLIGLTLTILIAGTVTDLATGYTLVKFHIGLEHMEAVRLVFLVITGFLTSASYVTLHNIYFKKLTEKVKNG